MTDTSLQRDIIDELDFEPSIDAYGLRVTVNDGIAWLGGHVRTYGEKLAAIEIVESLRGIRAVADEIEVRPAGNRPIEDAELARRIQRVFEWYACVPHRRIHVAVHKGHVVLTGTVDWRCQSEAAVKALSWLCGVVSLDNRLSLVPAARCEDVTERIRKALLRDAELDAAHVRITVDGGVVTLTGHVRYPRDRRAVERAAWAAPGVTRVVDDLTVS